MKKLPKEITNIIERIFDNPLSDNQFIGHAPNEEVLRFQWNVLKLKPKLYKYIDTQLNVHITLIRILNNETLFSFSFKGLDTTEISNPKHIFIEIKTTWDGFIVYTISGNTKTNIYNFNLDLND